MTSSKLDLGELVKKLKYEKLFIANERREIEALNKKVSFYLYKMYFRDEVLSFNFMLLVGPTCLHELAPAIMAYGTASISAGEFGEGSTPVSFLK